MLPKAFLVLVNIPRAEWNYAISDTRQLIGRASDAPVRLPASHRTVSRRHAMVWHDRGNLWLCDLQSRGGTRVNGIWLKSNEPAIIVEGDRLTLGGTEMRIEPALPDQVPSSNGHAVDPDLHASETMAFAPHPAIGTRSLMEGLTYCEHNVVLWMGRGYIQDRDLSKLLHRSPHTVRTQIGQILKKLGARSRAAVVDLVHREGADLRVCRAARGAHIP